MSPVYDVYTHAPGDAQGTIVISLCGRKVPPDRIRINDLKVTCPRCRRLLMIHMRGG